MSYLQENTKPVTLFELGKMRAEGRKIVMLTGYDASFAALLERCGQVVAGEAVGPAGPELLQEALDGTVLERTRDALEGATRIKEIARGLAAFSRVERTELRRVEVSASLLAAASLARNEIKYRATGMAATEAVNCIPALLNRMSMEPISASILATSRCTEPSSVTSKTAP